LAYGSITNFPYGVTSFGIPVLGSGGGIPLTNTGGHYWFVSSMLGNNGNSGSFSSPFATLSYALGISGLQANDTIVVLEGHTENVTAAAGILCSVAGVDIVGQGAGIGIPTITFKTATTATFKITGAGTTISGIKFVSGINSLVTTLDIQAKGVVIQGNVFQDDGTNTALSFIDFAGASANASDGTKILGNYFYNPTAGNFNHAIGLTTVQDNIEIGGNYIVGSFALSGIHNITGKVMTNLNVHDNYVRNLTASKPALNFISASTGVAYRNVFEPGANTPNSAIFGTALDPSGGNIGQGGRLDAGSEFWVVKTGVVSSTIVTGGVDLSVVSIGGPIAITDAIVKTDGTGLAGGTNFQIQTNNAKGAAVFFSNAVSGLGANATVNLTGAGVTKTETVLETGKKIQLSSTGSNCTGAGTIDVYLKCIRLTAGADVSLV
jgi:hypothetical protein